MITLSAAFDGGNGRAVDLSDPSNLQVEIVAEPFTAYDKRAHFQWFCFRLSGVRNTPLTVNIVNAGKCSFPEAWPGYKACASYDYQPDNWFRVDTAWDASAGVLTLRHAPDRDSIWFSFFAPYTRDRHLQLVGGVQSARPEVVRHEVLGRSCQGRDIDMLRFAGADSDAVAGGAGGDERLAVWVVARQHPGEPNSEWFMEGLLNRLASAFDPGAAELLRRAVVYAVPCVCPDGASLGHLRTNALGANLNREWAAPSEGYSPEVACILRRMGETGCDAFLDIHGDEEVTYNFVDGDDGVASFSAEVAAQQDLFRQSLAQASRDFKPTDFYGVTPRGEAEMGIACNAVGERFRCFSMTVELPSKDVEANPEPVHGWSPRRSMEFGRACLEPLLRVVQRIAEVKAAGSGAAEPSELPTKRAKLVAETE